MWLTLATLFKIAISGHYIQHFNYTSKTLFNIQYIHHCICSSIVLFCKWAFYHSEVRYQRQYFFSQSKWVNQIWSNPFSRIWKCDHQKKTRLFTLNVRKMSKYLLFARKNKLMYFYAMYYICHKLYISLNLKMVFIVDIYYFIYLIRD